MFSFYPNPSSESITIIMREKATIEILTIEGQIIKSINSDGLRIKIDLRNFPGGVYIIKAKTDKEIVTKTLIKD